MGRLARWADGDPYDGDPYDGEPAEWTIGDTGVIEFADVDGAPPWDVLADPAHYALPKNVPGPDPAGKQESGEPLTGWACTSGPGTQDVPGQSFAPTPAGGEPASSAAGNAPGPAQHPPGAGPGDLDPFESDNAMAAYISRLEDDGWDAARPIMGAWYAAREVTFR